MYWLFHLKWSVRFLNRWMFPLCTFPLGIWNPGVQAIMQKKPILIILYAKDLLDVH